MNNDYIEYEEISSSSLELSSKDSYNDSVPVYRRPNSSFVENAQSISNLVQQNQDIINKTLDLSHKIADVYSESQRLNAQIEFTKENTKVQLANIAAKYLTAKNVIEEIFAERKGALSAHYKVLDEGIRSGDKDLIVKAMREISNVVVSSPLEDLNSFIERYNDTSQPLLDF